MSKHIIGETICECGKEVKWVKFYYADIFRGERPEWRVEDGRVEVDKNNQVLCKCGRKIDVN